MAANKRFLTVLALLTHGFLGVVAHTVSVSEGDSVTLRTDVKIYQLERMKWYCNDIRIAQISRGQSKTCTDDECEERFRDRLKLDPQTGSLTITDIRTTDSGVYQLLSSSSSGEIFRVSVHDVRNEMKRMSVKEGGSVDLHPAVPKLPDDVMMWCFNETLIAEITGGQSKICENAQCEERFRDRLMLDHQTGSLTITNITDTDSGEYQLKITSNRDRCSITSVERFSVSVTYQSEGVARTSDPDSGLSSAAVAGIWVAAVVLILAAGAAVIYLWRSSRNDERRPRGQGGFRDVLLDAPFPSSPGV